MRPRFSVLPAALAASLVASGPLPARAETFAPAEIARWRPHVFSGETAYRLVDTPEGQAVRADCAASASGLFREAPVDLTATPVIEWRWRVDAPLAGSAGERTKPGDDFAARLYVVRDGGLRRWRTRALNYVWARAEPEGADWPNPFAEQARMVAVASGGSGWRTERRNVREDFRRLHGLDVERIDAVAIMTDCDNGGGTAEAFYGEIRFLPE